jgi:hypothetical protein
VSAFIRPIASAESVGGKDVEVIRRKALFVVVNEGNEPVREQLYIQQPQYLFAGPNRMTIASIYARLDFSRIPADSDWGRKKVLTASPEGDPLAASMERSRGTATGRETDLPKEQLMDLETGGYVRKDKIRERRDWDKGTTELEVYGPLYVPARGMRLLYGEGSQKSASR